jgi:diaminopimelate decarboxylase
MHAMAFKSNAVARLMPLAHGMGFGAEVASIGELMHAEKLGYSPETIVFDSPAKTPAEIFYALKAGIHVNIDNFEELDIVAACRAKLSEDSKSDIGIRINPLVGAGEIAALSVSTEDSKFGISLDRKTEILAAYAKYPWLNTVHVHVGSGGMGVKVLVEGVSVTVEFAQEVNKHVGKHQVNVLDMGGGMPVNYSGETWTSEKVPSFHEYAAALRKRVPQLFPTDPSSPFRRVITEFGQSLNAKGGWLCSRVQYIKPLGNDGKIAVLHFGADVCVRQAYTTEHKRRVEFYDGINCAVKQATDDKPATRVHVVGPLCFQGDNLTKEAEVPDLRSDDFVILRDAGANTMSLFSRHCMRQSAPVYGYRASPLRSGEDYEVSEWKLLKPIEDAADCSRFWGQDS